MKKSTCISGPMGCQSCVILKNGFLNLRPVKTTAPIPKDRIAALTQKINRLTALVNTGGIIIKNVSNTGAASAALHSAARTDGLCSNTP